MIPCVHSGNIGDIIYALPAIKTLADKRNTKIALYLKPNVLAGYYPGASHPLGHVRLNDDYCEKLYPLLCCQHYLETVEKHQGQPVECDLDQFRKVPPDPTKGHIPRWYFPLLGVCCDLSDPWLTICAAPSNTRDHNVLISRTSRYQNPRLNYSFLSKYDCAFVGLPSEHKEFCSRFFDLPHIKVDDFAMLAGVIAAAALFIGNQSFPYALAEAIKVPRVLEVCHFANNVIPHGRRAYEAYRQRDFEIFVTEELK